MNYMLTRPSCSDVGDPITLFALLYPDDQAEPWDLEVGSSPQISDHPHGYIGGQRSEGFREEGGNYTSMW